MKSIGEQSLVNLSSLIDSVARYPVVHRGICDMATFERMVEAARLELADAEAEPYIQLFIAWGRK